VSAEFEKLLPVLANGGVDFILIAVSLDLRTATIRSRILSMSKRSVCGSNVSIFPL